MKTNLLNKNKRMHTLTSILYNTTFGKIIFTYVYSITTIGIVQDASLNHISFIDSLLNNVPAQVLYVLGIIYAIVVVLKFASKAWKDYLVNILEVKMKKEKLNQEVLKTSILKNEISNK